MRIKRFQEGGMAPGMDPSMDPAVAEGSAPVEQGPASAGPQGGDPLMQIAQLAAQALQSQDCQAAMAVCDAFLQLISQAQGPAPAGPPEGEPMFKCGGRLKGRKKVKRAKC